MAPGLVLVLVPQHGPWPMVPGVLAWHWRPACWPAAAGAVHQALPELVPGLTHGAGLVLVLPTRRCPSWRPA